MLTAFERLWYIVAENISCIIELHWRVWCRECRAVIHLSDKLQIILQLNGTNQIDRHSIIVGAKFRIVHSDVKL